jgi:hypothetical protein
LAALLFICVPTYHKGLSYPKNILCTKIDGDVCKDGEQHNYSGFIKAIFGVETEPYGLLADQFYV